MDHLSATQLRQAFGALGEVAELRDLADFPPRTAQLLRRLISCDISSYNAVDPRTRRATVAADPADCLFEGGAEAFACYAHQNPLVAHFARTGDGRALCIRTSSRADSCTQRSSTTMAIGTSGWSTSSPSRCPRRLAARR